MKLSVVLASHNARSSVAPCLAAVRKQARQSGESLEILVVDNSGDGTARILEKLRADGADFQWIRAAPDALIPQLWQIGISASDGEIVALSTTHCLPADDWIDQILEAHRQPHAAIGGAIESAPDAGWVQWAICFCRYSAYMLPFAPQLVSDVAADNASYKRQALENCRETWQHGFWEPAIHAQLRQSGETLLKTPAVVVFHQKSFSFAGFLIQRFHHGQQFGRERAARLGSGRRLIYILFSPLIPALFLIRIARQVVTKRRHLAQFCASLPILLLFLLSWSCGELRGYFQAPPR